MALPEQIICEGWNRSNHQAFEKLYTVNGEALSMQLCPDCLDRLALSVIQNKLDFVYYVWQGLKPIAAITRGLTLREWEKIIGEPTEFGLAKVDAPEPRIAPANLVLGRYYYLSDVEGDRTVFYMGIGSGLHTFFDLDHRPVYLSSNTVTGLIREIS